MTDFFDSLQQALVTAAEERHSEARARPLPRRRRIALGLAATLALVAVPAWATGILGDVFEEDHGTAGISGQAGRRVVLAEGTASARETYRLVGYRADLRDPRTPARGRATGSCVVLELRPRRGFARHVHPSATVSCLSDTARPRLPGRSSGVAGRPFGQARAGIVGPEISSVRVSFRSGRHLDVRPISPDAAALRKAGFPRPFKFLAFAAPPGDPVVGQEAAASSGSERLREGHPTPAHGRVKVRVSPAF